MFQGLGQRLDLDEDMHNGVVQDPPANAGDTGDVGSILGLGRSPGRGNGNPWTEEPAGYNPWGVTKSQTRLTD